MELQTNPLLRIRTPRVKAIADAPNYPEVLVCLFTGEIQLYNKDTLQLTRSLQVGSTPIRTGVLVPSRDWILLGTDDGNIVVLDLGNLSIISQVQAHDDFVRKIVLDEDNKRFITVSDDNTTKLWSYEKNILLVNRYKNAKHFVMDACFCPRDHSIFFAVSLDCKVYQYSVQHDKCVKTFKGHEKGVNCIAFINHDCFVTGSDDSTLIVWDYKRGAQVAQLRGHTNNVNSVHKIRKGFASCSEDSTMRLWDENLKTVEIRNMAGRVWCALEREGRVFVGSDEELVVFAERMARSMAAFSESRVFYNTGSALRAVKLEEHAFSLAPEGCIKDIGAYKEIGSVEDGFDGFSVSKNGKLVAVSYDQHFSVYSSLGLRKKFSETGRDFIFAENDSFAFRKGESLCIYDKFEPEAVVPVAGLSAVLFVDEGILAINKGNTCIIDRKAVADGETLSEEAILHEFNFSAWKAFCLEDILVLFTDKVLFYDTNFENIATLEYAVVSHCVDSDVLYFSTQHKTFYCFVAAGQVHVFPMKFVKGLFGASEGVLYCVNGAVTAFRVDSEFLAFQMAVLRGSGEAKTSEKILDKAIAFYAVLGMYEKALECCRGENQRFEILLKLERLDEAFCMANAPIKFKKLGKAFLLKKRLDMAAECFYRAGDMNSLLLTDIFGEKKHLREVAEASKRNGENNLAFMALYKNGDYAECRELLRETPFYNVFSQFYCSE